MENKVVDYDKLHDAWNIAHDAGSPVKYVREKVIRRYLYKLHPGRTLEAGCGFGYHSSLLEENGHAVYAFDPSINAINYVKKKFQGKNVVADVSTCEDYSSEMIYDNIVCFEVFEHLENDYKSLDNLLKFLKKSGNLILSVPADPFLFGEDDKIAGHFRRYTKKKLLKLLNDNGLVVEEIVGYGFPLLYAYLILKKKKIVRNIIENKIKNNKKYFFDEILKKIIHAFLFIDSVNMRIFPIGYVVKCRKVK